MKLLTILLGTLFAVSSFAAMTITTGANRTANADTATKVCASATDVRSIVITCLNSNTEGCMVGDSNVDHPTLRGIYLAKGTSVTIEAEPGSTRRVIDCNTIYFEIGVNGEGISYTYLN